MAGSGNGAWGPERNVPRLSRSGQEQPRCWDPNGCTPAPRCPLCGERWDLFSCPSSLAGNLLFPHRSLQADLSKGGR